MRWLLLLSYIPIGQLADFLCFSSPKDQAILEAEYKHNPKPNKAARAVIMEKVDLNEKELQVSLPSRGDVENF